MASVVVVVGCFQVILCVKGVNEKVRVLALKLLANLGHAAQRCFGKKPQGMFCSHDFGIMIVCLSLVCLSVCLLSLSLCSLSLILVCVRSLVGLPITGAGWIGWLPTHGILHTLGPLKARI